jgi:hypothetical protein
MFNPIEETSAMTPAQSKDLSIHPEYNPAYFVPGYNPFENPSCRMHQFDHGNYVYVKQLVVEFLSKMCNNSSLAIQKFDMRWALLSTYPGGKVFKRGVSGLSWVTCHEHRIMAMGLPFIVRGLDIDLGVTNVEGYSHGLLEDLAITYLCMRWLIAHEGFTDLKLDALDSVIKRFQDLLDKLNKVVHGTTKQGCIKFHRLCHWRDYIIRFGATGNYDSGVFESGHRFACKVWKNKISFKQDGSAAHKMMRKWEIGDAHMDSTPTKDGIRSNYCFGIFKY